MESYVEQYFSCAIRLLQTILQESGSAIQQAAEALADTIKNGHNVLLYGSGHSTLIAHDAACRAGALVPFLAIQDVANGDAERIEGIAQVIVKPYELRPGSVMIVLSNSGINPVPIEMAILCKEAGLKVIAITSLAHSKSVNSRHSSGAKLYELADIVIDTHVVKGDVAIDLPGGKSRSGATSSVAVTTILQAINVQAAAILAESGIEPPMFASANMPGGDAHNRKMVSCYRSRLVRYQIPNLGQSGADSEG